MKHELTAGIDIGGTNTDFGLVDRTGRILLKDTVATGSFKQAEHLVETVSAKIKGGLKSLGNAYTLTGTGIGAPNGNHFNGTIEFASNLGWRENTPIRDLFENALHVKTLLTNDAKAGAMGEMLFGGAKGMRDFIYITLGTGLGSGIVTDGRLVYGHDGLAGEMGHIIMFPNGRRCSCGRAGCLETYCSATGLKRTYLESLWSKGIKSEGLKDIHTKDIYEKAAAGEQDAIDAFHYTGEILGMALANSVNYFSPEAIFLFGGLAQAGDYIFDPTISGFEKNLLKIYRGKTRILPSQLLENEAAVLGAASLFWK